MIYEFLYVIPALYTDAELAPIQAKVTAVLEAAGAKILQAQGPEKLRFAYAVKQVKYGQFYHIYMEAPPEALPKIQGQLRLLSELVRHQIVSSPKATIGPIKLASFEDVRLHIREERGMGGMGGGRERRSFAPRSDVQPAPAAPLVPAAPSLSMEELDKKLDQILGEDAEAAV